MRNGEVVIIDEFTGRMMPGRRYSEGLHQALEAKEHQPIQPENQTLASITFQNYFRMYEKLAGMTGTALTEADEFLDIYNLEVVEVPTNMPMVRIDDDDEVYRTAAEKYRAILALIEDCKARGQPVLVGTTSIEKSEQLAEMLRQAGLGAARLLPTPTRSRRSIPATTAPPRPRCSPSSTPATTSRKPTSSRRPACRARSPSPPTWPAAAPTSSSAAMPTCASARSSPTSRTRASASAIRARPRSAPRWRGSRRRRSPAGGLFVLGTERHESRRIDNQLRGRSGRQGDPGHSKFFLSLEDDLMRIFGSDKLDGMLQRLGLKENEAIVHSWINKALEKAQQKVEARNFDIRKNLLKFDNVMNDQRKVIFEQRIEWMRDEAVHEIVADMRHAAVDDLVAKHVPENAYPEQWDTKGLREELKRVLSLDLPVDEWAKEEGIADEELLARIERRADEHMAAKVAQWGADVMRYVEKSILLQTLDHLWREHLVMLEHLRQVIGLRGYGQRDPLNEYKAEVVQPVRGDEHQSARSGDVAIDAGRDQDGAAGGRRRRCPTWRRTRSIRRPARTRWRWPMRRCVPAFAGNGNGTARAADAQSQRSDELGQGRPQRSLPVRLRQEVQALPRPVRLSGQQHDGGTRAPFPSRRRSGVVRLI